MKISETSARDTGNTWTGFLILGSAIGLFILGIVRFLSTIISFGDVNFARGFTSVGLLLLATFAGWVLADFCSGVVHFVADNYGSPKTPLLGRTIIAPFRQHHLAPTQMLAHGFLERNANNAFATVPLLVWIPLTPLNSPLLLFGSALSLQLSAWILVTNEIHAICHKRTTNRLLRWLQEKGLLLDPEQHARHHDATNEAPRSRFRSDHFHYCITSGICDRWARALLGRFEKRTHPPQTAP